jgi:hypothetical protein
MAAKPREPNQMKPWDRAPWPKRGNRKAGRLYAAIGFALTSWEYYEDALGGIFALFVAGGRSKAAVRAYFSVRTFEGRADMLRAASQAYFSEHPNSELQQQFKAILSAATSFAPRRNDIAHGVVDQFRSDPASARPRRLKSFGLYPSYANFKDRALDQTPSYCYSSVEIDRYSDEFSALQMAAGFFQEGLRKELGAREIARAIS